MITVFLFAVIGIASATIFQDCGSLASNVTLSVEGCDTPPCILQRGSTYLINYKFIASTDSDTLKIDASANIGGIQVPWPGLDSDACKELEDTDNPCPIEKDGKVDWSMEAEVLKEYPKITTMVTFKLIDGDGGLQTCSKLPAIIS